MKFFTYILVGVLHSFLQYNAFAAELGKQSGLPIPRFVALRSNEVNLRNGPSSRYPIKWIYKKRGYPMQVIAEFDNWRKIRDIDGEDGWVHEALISGHRSAIVSDQDTSSKDGFVLLLRLPKEDAYPMARLEFGTVVSIKKCDTVWCKVDVEKYQGWVKQENLWGVMKDEIIK